MEPELLDGRMPVNPETRDARSDNEPCVGGVDQAFTVEMTKSHSSGQSN